MKKLAVILAGMLTATAAFAMPAMHTDVQVHTGIGFDTVKIKDGASDVKGKSVLFNLDAQSWNFFELNDFIGVGFVVGTDFGWGGVSKFTVNGVTADSNTYKDAFHWNIIVAPAVSLSFDFVKVQASAGFNFAINPGFAANIAPNGVIYTCYPFAFGFVTDVQAKFFPDKKFSPVAGFRWGLTGSKREKIITRNNNTVTKQNIDKGSYSFCVIYLGAAYNF